MPDCSTNNQKDNCTLWMPSPKVAWESSTKVVQRPALPSQDCRNLRSGTDGRLGPHCSTPWRLSVLTWQAGRSFGSLLGLSWQVWVLKNCVWCHSQAFAEACGTRTFLTAPMSQSVQGTSLRRIVLHYLALTLSKRGLLLNGPSG